MDPDNTKIFFNKGKMSNNLKLKYIGLCFFKLKKFDEAIYFLNKVLIVDPGHKFALFIKGKIIC